MADLTPSRREFLRNALGVVILSTTAPAIVLGRIFPKLAQSGSSLVATYVINLSDYPALNHVGGSVKLTSPQQLLLNPDQKSRGFTGKTFPIAVTRIAESGTDAFVSVSTYCTHGADYQVRDYDPAKGWFVCPHQSSTFKADGTHVTRVGTPNVGPLRKFATTFDAAAGTITINGVLQVADVDADDGVPEQAFLDQNYPNPFNPTTLIHYGVPERTRVTITVHSLLGNQVATIVDEVREAGIYTEDFSARDIPSGMYFYRMHTDSGTLTRRMTVTK